MLSELSESKFEHFENVFFKLCGWNLEFGVKLMQNQSEINQESV